MQNWKKRLSEIGDVEPFDYDYMREGRKRPDPLPKLIAVHREALAKAREKHRSARTFLIGKSMGGRVGCHVSLEEKVDGLICLGYPLCAMGDRSKLRDQVLRALTTPILFVQGTDDSLCPLDLLERVRSEMKAPNFCAAFKTATIPCALLNASFTEQAELRRISIKKSLKLLPDLLTDW